MFDLMQELVLSEISASGEEVGQLATPQRLDVYA
jgi:hypothetical protein